MRSLAIWGLLSASVVLSACEELPPAPETPDEPPSAAFFFTPIAPIYAGQSAVLFNGAGSRDLDGRIESYIWNFGDGTPEQTTTEPVTRHTFPDTGARCLEVTYGVSLVVVDNRGGRDVASHGVTVTELPAPATAECALLLR